MTLSGGATVTAGVVIGADGSAGVTSRHVGVSFGQEDLGLEAELAATDADRAAWRDRVLLDWGPVPGSDGWVFPKNDQLTVGVIMSKGRGADTKRSRYMPGIPTSCTPRWRLRWAGAPSPRSAVANSPRPRWFGGRASTPRSRCSAGARHR